LIDRMLPQGAFVALYGAPESGKSFLAIDIALSVAAGGTWHGTALASGPVLYVGAEGGTGIGKRVRAWLTARGVEARQAPVMWLVESIPVYGDSGAVATLLERVQDEIKVVPKLIVIDTLARCLDGDENQQEDMGRFVQGCDRLRHEFGATLIAVHHTRLDGDRERGSTAFRGATDTMMEVKRHRHDLVLTCTKQKDAEHFTPLAFHLKVIPEADSCVLVQTRTARKEQHLVDILDILHEAGPLTATEWWELVSESAGMARSTFFVRIVGLIKTGQIVQENGKYREC
jgi:RecA-family ATPase